MAIALKRFPRQPAVGYAELRRELRSGDLLLCSGTGMFSRMIQAVSESVWSHVAFVMRLDAIDRVMVLESLEPIGVRTVPLRKYLEDYDSHGNPYPGRLAVVRHADFAERADQEALRRLGKFAVDLFGYPYDKDEIAKIAARIVASKIGFTRRVRQAVKRDREYICSEYVWECYKSLGIHIDYDRRGFIAPADFARARGVQLQAVVRFSA